MDINIIVNHLSVHFIFILFIIFFNIKNFFNQNVFSNQQVLLN